MATSYDVPTAEKTIRLIELLCQKNESIGVREIASELDLSSNMVFRLLHTLCKTGWVIKEEEGPKYKMSLQAFQQTSKIVENLKFKEISAPFLRDLHKKTGECVHSNKLDGDGVVIIDVYETSKHLIKISPAVGGGGSNFHIGVGGKVYLAFDEEFLSKYQNKKLVKKTENTITTKKRLLEEVSIIQKNGYATEDGEGNENIACIGAPVFNYDGKLEGVISMSVLSFTISLEDAIKEYKDLIVETANKISKIMGYQNS